MGFERDRLPEAQSYFEAQGLKLSRGKKWISTACTFHQGSDSMRINLHSGAWVCMACNAKGGDVLSYHMAAYGMEFIDAAKELGAWAEDGRPAPANPAPFTPRQAIGVLMPEVNFIAIAAGNIAHGVALSDNDRTRLMQAAGRVLHIAEAFE
jgi:hypothetical protein